MKRQGCWLVLGVVVWFGAPAAGDELNCLLRKLGYGWSDGYHARSPALCSDWVPCSAAPDYASEVPTYFGNAAEPRQSAPGVPAAATSPLRPGQWSVPTAGPTSPAAPSARVFRLPPVTSQSDPSGPTRSWIPVSRSPGFPP